MPAPSVSSYGAYATAQNDLAINTGITLAGTGNLLLIVEQAAKALVAGMIAPKLDGVDMTQVGTTNGPLSRFMAVTTAGAHTLTTRTSGGAYEAHLISWRTYQDTATSGARYQNPQNFSGSSAAPSSGSLTCPTDGALDAGYVKSYSGSAPTISAGTQLGSLFDGGTGNSMAGGTRSSTGAISWSSGDSNAWYLSALEILGDAAAGTPTGLATETDAALALAGKQIRALGLATETDTALALTPVTLAGLPFNTAPYEFGQRTGLDVADFSIYASTSLNVSVFADADVLLASRLFAYTESTGTDGRLTRKTHASLTAGAHYFFVARNADGSLSGCGRIQAT